MIIIDQIGAKSNSLKTCQTKTAINLSSLYLVMLKFLAFFVRLSFAKDMEF